MRRHEEGTCDNDGAHDGEPPCPGDPCCSYTMLARIQHRYNMQEAMKRLLKALKDQVPTFPKAKWGHKAWPLKRRQEWYETLYTIVCAVKGHEVRAPVDATL